MSKQKSVLHVLLSENRKETNAYKDFINTHECSMNHECSSWSMASQGLVEIVCAIQRVTHKQINKLQNYYEIVVHQFKGTAVYELKKCISAVLYHCSEADSD